MTTRFPFFLRYFEVMCNSWWDIVRTILTLWNSCKPTIPNYSCCSIRIAFSLLTDPRIWWGGFGVQPYLPGFWGGSLHHSSRFPQHYFQLLGTLKFYSGKLTPVMVSSDNNEGFGECQWFPKWLGTFSGLNAITVCPSPFQGLPRMRTIVVVWLTLSELASSGMIGLWINLCRLWKDSIAKIFGHHA